VGAEQANNRREIQAEQGKEQGDRLPPVAHGQAARGVPKRKAPGRTKLRAPERQARINAIAEMAHKGKREARFPHLKRPQSDQPGYVA